MAAAQSGQYQVQGTQALNGAKAWVNDTNAAGGVFVLELDLKLPLRLIAYDDRSSARRVRELIAHLVLEDRVDILLGPYASGLSLAAAETAESMSRVLWNHGGSADVIHQGGLHWVVGVLSPASQYLQGAVDLLREADPGAGKVAILQSATGSFSASVANGFKGYALRQGLEVVYEGQYQSPASDFSSVLRELSGVSADLLVGVGRIGDDLLLAQQIPKGVAKAVALVATPIQQFHAHLGNRANGFIGPSQWEPLAITKPDYGPSADSIFQKLASPGGQSLDYPMVQGYAAGLVAQRCIEEAGTLDNAALRQAAGTLDFTTFYGRFKIHPNTGEQMGHSVVLVQWQNGKKVIVWPKEVRQGRLVYPMRND